MRHDLATHLADRLDPGETGTAGGPRGRPGLLAYRPFPGNRPDRLSPADLLPEIPMVTMTYTGEVSPGGPADVRAGAAT